MFLWFITDFQRQNLFISVIYLCLLSSSSVDSSSSLSNWTVNDLLPNDYDPADIPIVIGQSITGSFILN
jgi:hypothetical protein